LPASAIINSSVADRTKEIALMDLVDPWDSKYCLDKFDSFTISSPQITDPVKLATLFALQSLQGI
jgi:hypothetical protein